MKALQHPYASAHFIHGTRKSIITRFLEWCNTQEKHRLLWVGLIIAGHGCVITPITVLAILFSGNSMLMWAFAIGAMAIPLVSNLAAMPTKITIPIFFASLAIDIAIFISSIVTVLTV